MYFKRVKKYHLQSQYSRVLGRTTSSSNFWVMPYLALAVIKHHDKNQLVEERIYFSFKVHYERKSWQELKPRP